MSSITLNVIEGLVIYDLCRIFLGLTIRLVTGLLMRGEDDGE
jgi:hypothetical protein